MTLQARLAGPWNKNGKRGGEEAEPASQIQGGRN